MSKKILFILLLCFIITSCGKDKSDTNTENSKETKVPKAEKVEFVMKEYKKTYKDCDQNSEGCSYINFNYPEILNADIKDKVNSAIGTYLRDSIYSIEGKNFKNFDELASTFFAEYDTMKRISSVQDLAFVLDEKAEIISETEKDFTVSISYYISTGGAHPNSFMSYFVFDKLTGNIITLNNFFKPGYDSLLNKLVDGAYRKEKGLSPTDDLQKKGDLFENKITFNNNFAVTKDSLKFFYNNYEIAAYVFGPTEISIPLNDLKEYVKQE